jgi:hypothetical protein
MYAKHIKGIAQTTLSSLPPNPSLFCQQFETLFHTFCGGGENEESSILRLWPDEMVTRPIFCQFDMARISVHEIQLSQDPNLLVDTPTAPWIANLRRCMWNFDISTFHSHDAFFIEIYIKLFFVLYSSIIGGEEVFFDILYNVIKKSSTWLNFFFRTFSLSVFAFSTLTLNFSMSHLIS